MSRKRLIILMSIIVTIFVVIFSIYFYIWYNENYIIEKFHPIHGDLYLKYYDEGNDSAVFCIRLGEPSKYILDKTKIAVILSNGSAPAIRTNNYTIIDSDYNGYINTGDFLVIYNASKYIGWSVAMSFEGYTGTIAGRIQA